jgi:hypothetical protein
MLKHSESFITSKQRHIRKTPRCQLALNKLVEAVEAVEIDLPNTSPRECSRVLDRRGSFSARRSSYLSRVRFFSGPGPVLRRDRSPTQLGEASSCNDFSLLVALSAAVLSPTRLRYVRRLACRDGAVALTGADPTASIHQTLID